VKPQDQIAAIQVGFIAESTDRLAGAFIDILPLFGLKPGGLIQQIQLSKDVFGSHLVIVSHPWAP
jgi:hypothetical protein